MRTTLTITGIICFIISIFLAYLVFVVLEKNQLKQDIKEDSDEDYLHSYFSGRQDFFFILMLFFLSVFALIFIFNIIPQISKILPGLIKHIV